MLERELRKQFDRAAALGWIDHFEEASARYGEAPENLLAIGSRETNLDPKYLHAPGDGGHGFGLMQVDRGSFPAWCESGAWRDPRQAILKGSSILAAKRKELVDRAGHPVRVTSHDGHTTRTFTMPAFDEPELTRVAIADYNGGDWPAYHASRGRDPDQGTTMENYSTDVLDRAQKFRKFLDARKPLSDSSTSTEVEKQDTPAPPAEASPAIDADLTPLKEAGVLSGAKAFGKILLGGYKRVVGWITGAGITYNTGIFEKRPWLVGLLAIALVAAFVWFYFKVHKKGSSR